MANSLIKYPADMNAENSPELNVIEYCHDLIMWLEDDYIENCIKELSRRGVGESQIDSQILKMKNKIEFEYIIESGRKYHKIIEISYSNRSVHCFVDMKTGDVYKAASWKSPAQRPRFNLLSENDREWLRNHADYAGRYLYLRL
ncbi:hypothetical protein b3_0222 [Synechococcus phage B3]|nr:hypothetical protein b3_0222 [Synechococcus phage B3]QGT54835.1 hypothetical protein b23_0220 [Synechococcus phage B23]